MLVFHRPNRLLFFRSQTVGHGEQQLHVQDAVQHDPLQQRTVHGQDPQQDLGPLPAEEVQQVGEVHHVSVCVCRPPPLATDCVSKWSMAAPGSSGQTTFCLISPDFQRQHLGAGHFLRGSELRDHRAEEGVRGGRSAGYVPNWVPSLLMLMVAAEPETFERLFLPFNEL